MDFLRAINPADLVQGVVVLATVAGLASVLKLIRQCDSTANDARAKTEWLRFELENVEMSLGVQLEAVNSRVARLEQAETSRQSRAEQKQREKKKVRVIAAPKTPTT
jgi:hypothetical protein